MKEVTAIVVHAEAVRPLPELAEAINQAHQDCEEAVRVGLQYALEAGRLLNEAKKRVPYGEWLKWSEASLTFSGRTARDYMRLDRERARLADWQHAANLTIREALALLADPDATDGPTDQADQASPSPPSNGQPSPVPPGPSPSSAPSFNGPSPRTRSRDAKAPDAPPTREETQAVADRWKDVPPTSPAPAIAKPTEDALGNPLPDLLKDVFADATLGSASDLVKGWLGQFRYDATMRAVAARIRFLPYLRTGQLLEQFKAAEEALEVALETIEAGRPYAVCPVCAGYGCENCRKAGYVPSWRLEELKREGNA